MMSESSSLPFPRDAGESQETTSGGKQEEVRWVEVAQTPGLTPAQIMAGRLQAEGIPAYAWQEGAGQATGLVIGLLGAGHVMVPEEFEDKALQILSEDAGLDETE
jgi:hypothetical protein